MDALIDGLRVQIGKDVVRNHVLRLSDSLILAGSSEVVFNLTTAKTGLSRHPSCQPRTTISMAWTGVVLISQLVGNAPRLGLPNPNSSARTVYVPASGSGVLLLVPTETGDLINLAASAYPMMDNLGTTPLTSIAMTNGLTFSWNSWAAASPHMRMVEMRAVITSTASAPVKQVVTLIPMSATQLTLPSFAGLVPADAIQFTLWLIARDDQGRRYVSQIVADS